MNCKNSITVARILLIAVAFYGAISELARGFSFMGVALLVAGGLLVVDVRRRRDPSS